jgi:UDP-N-acetylmuramoyl-tripeptide--D-alanyl-D-alanine ligase
MIPLALHEVAAAVGGRLHGEAGETQVTGVSLDSRRLQAGDLFIGVRGEHFDGDRFAAAALAAGAVCVVVRADTAAALPPAAPRIVVAEGLEALQALAAEVRRRSSARLAAITGSTGKTSTKDILASLLAPVARTVATQGNHNNEVGVPLTLLRAEPDTEVIVTELAMRGRGQIRQLARMAAPDVGVITNIAPVHLELVGEIEDVAAAKAELIEELGERAVVVPGDEPLLAPYLAHHRGRVITFGDLGSNVHLVDVEYGEQQTRAVVDAFGRRARLRFNFTGGHYLTDALAALAAFLELGYPMEAARQGAASIVFSELRGEIVQLTGGGFLLNDAYNANPLAMHAAVDHLLQLAAGRSAVAVLGDMYELGPQSHAFHVEVGKYVAERGVKLVAVGELGRGYLSGSPGEVWHETVDACIAALCEDVPPGSAVLVKASRALRLERVADALKATRAVGSDDRPETADPRD